MTGSKHLLETGGHRILVDCGLFQGLKVLRERNWQALPVRAETIDAVVLTHAHLDHCGYLPRLVAQGFRGRIFCTAGTADLARIVLADAAKLQEEDAERANRKAYTRHHPALPLYTVDDANKAMLQLQPIGYNRPMPIAPGVEAEFINAGHLLGSAYARITIVATGQVILFGGDLGRYGRPVLPDPTSVSEADVLLVESTYGDRVHVPDDDGAQLARVITETMARGGRLIIPAFAIGRVEELLYWIRHLEVAGRIPHVPVYLDSPMAIAALAEYRKRVQEMDPDIAEMARFDTHGAAQAHRQVCAFCTSRLTVVSSVAESRAVQESDRPAIVISSSGMATGGRVLHHLFRALPDDRNTVLLVGFQAEGTRGRKLKDGARYVRMHGQDVPVRARVETVDSMSAHADAGEIMRWLSGFTRPPALTCLVHGEPSAMDALEARIERELGWRVKAPEQGERIDV